MMSTTFSLASSPQFLAFSGGRRRRREVSSSFCRTHFVPPFELKRCVVGFDDNKERFGCGFGFVSPRAGLSSGTEVLLHDAGATVAILVGGYALVFGFNDLTRRQIVQQVYMYMYFPTFYLSCMLNKFEIVLFSVWFVSLFRLSQVRGVSSISKYYKITFCNSID